MTHSPYLLSPVRTTCLCFFIATGGEGRAFNINTWFISYSWLWNQMIARLHLHSMKRLWNKGILRVYFAFACLNLSI